MIGKLKGLIDSYGEDFVILDVNGVGYVVQCSARTLQKLPRAGEAASLAIETQVREDAIRLFGFTSDAERDWFRLLQSVQGVGSKVALAILGVLGPNELASAIARAGQGLHRPRAGRRPQARRAHRRRTEGQGARLRPCGPARRPPRRRGRGRKGAPTPVRDAISALVNLGYGRPQAAAAVAASVKALGEDAQTSALIRQGLKELAS